MLWRNGKPVQATQYSRLQYGLGLQSHGRIRITGGPHNALDEYEARTKIFDIFYVPPAYSLDC